MVIESAFIVSELKNVGGIVEAGFGGPMKGLATTAFPLASNPLLIIELRISLLSFASSQIDPTDIRDVLLHVSL